MPNILVIDTSTEACSVAVQVGDKVFDAFQIAPRMHGELVLPLVDELLGKAGVKLTDLDVIGYGQGPGAFTGLRICISIVQGLAYGADVPVVGVSSLQAMAQAAMQNHQTKNVFAAIDARMGEVYWGQYQQAENGLMELIGSEKVSNPENVEASNSAEDGQVYWAVGSGWQTYHSQLAQAINLPIVIEKNVSFPSAKTMLAIVNQRFNDGLAVSAEMAQPVYLRNNVAKKKAEQGKKG